MTIRGVSWNKNNRRWRVSHPDVGYIGEFLTEEEATTVRRSAERRYDGYEHAQPYKRTVGDVTHVLLLGRRGWIMGWALIDAADAHLLGDHRWCLSVSGYVVTRRGGKIVYLHRLVLPGSGVADHISGDKKDCRRANLRLCTQRDNSRNRRLVAKNNTSGFKGVYRREGGAWVARICVNRVTLCLGQYPSARSAAAAYDEAARSHFGEFARTNFL